MTRLMKNSIKINWKRRKRRQIADNYLIFLIAYGLAGDSYGLAGDCFLINFNLKY